MTGVPLDLTVAVRLTDCGHAAVVTDDWSVVVVEGCAQILAVTTRKTGRNIHNLLV